MGINTAIRAFLIMVFLQKRFDIIKITVKIRTISKLWLNPNLSMERLYSSRRIPSVYMSVQMAKSRKIQEIYMINSIFSFRSCVCFKITPFQSFNFMIHLYYRTRYKLFNVYLLTILLIFIFWGRWIGKMVRLYMYNQAIR